MKSDLARAFPRNGAPRLVGGSEPPPDTSLPMLTDHLVNGRTRPVILAFSRPRSDPPVLTWSPTDQALAKSSHGRALSTWRELARAENAPIPSVDSFDILAFRPMIGSLMLLQPLEEGGDFLYRVYGTEIARFVGMELTGKRLSETRLPAFAKAFFRVTYGAVLRRPEPLLTRHVAPTDFLMATWQRLILPFVDDQGAVARFLVVNEPVRMIRASEHLT